LSHPSTPQHSLSPTDFPSLETTASCLSTNRRFRTQTIKLLSEPTSLQWRPQATTLYFRKISARNEEDLAVGDLLLHNGPSSSSSIKINTDVAVEKESWIGHVVVIRNCN